MDGSCCISHLFCKAASKNPDKVAVIHASGGAKLAREWHNNHDNNSNGVSEADYDRFLASHAAESSSHPPVYEGDRCFTFSEIKASVDSLSDRLRRILDGGDDPQLIRPPTGHLPSWQRVDVHISDPSKSSGSVKEQLIENQQIDTPKILAIYMSPSVEYIVAVLSVLRCGEAFMPLDPLWPKERILSVVSSSNIDLLIMSQPSPDGSYYYKLDKSHGFLDSGKFPIFIISMKDNLQEQFGSSNLAMPCDKRKLRTFCYLMYTSGSTGMPKGVCGTEPGLLNRFLWMQELYPLHGEEVMLFKTSISFIDHLQEFLGALLTTCTLVIPPCNELKENIFYMIDYLQLYSINRLIAVPSLMRAILPAMQRLHGLRAICSLKLLVLSGEVLPLSLWDTLKELLPKTSILNLYGSTEVSGDCTYFDCKKLPLILESESLESVPIGVPISNCDVVLDGEDSLDQGEIYVGGVCVAFREQGNQNYYKTGDFARRLQSGDLVFVGRKDRSVKVNGQRIALEEIEGTLRGHPNVLDAAVVSVKNQDVLLLEAYLVMKKLDECGKGLRASIRSWMVNKLPLAMIPNRVLFTKSIPKSSTGKVDYALLGSLTYSISHVKDEMVENQSTDILLVIKKAFCDALMVATVSNDDDFFAIGGNSLSAAHVSHNLGIDMRLLYVFPSPLTLQMALQQKGGLCDVSVSIDDNSDIQMKKQKDNILLPDDTKASTTSTSKDLRRIQSTLHHKSYHHPAKCLKVDSQMLLKSKGTGPRSSYFWNSKLRNIKFSFSRCNRFFYGGCEQHGLGQASRSMEVPRYKKGAMQEQWKVHMESCVDASPLIVFKDGDIFLLIGSHSHKFLCVDAKSGFIQWELKVEGRIECSAAILGDFSQVVVGCYTGNIYFIDFLSGNICWTFQTCGEVKSQPVVDKCRLLVWCGSYDHYLYALDYKNYCCVYKLPCGGSIYGSPAIDETQNTLYVASTRGRVTAISLKALPFGKLWVRELGAPVFGSLSINSQTGHVICCLVDGHVVALDLNGSIVWKGKTGGPIFAGPTISYALPSQVLICSRDGSIYSFEMENGDLLWEHNVGNPISSSAYVDENLQLVSQCSFPSDRLVCVCTSSGSIHLLRIFLDTIGEKCQPGKAVLEEFARFDFHGDIFSSPVMIGGRIFVGCRDDYVYCIEVKEQICEKT